MLVCDQQLIWFQGCRLYPAALLDLHVWTLNKPYTLNTNPTPQVKPIFAAAARGYGAETFDGLQEPDGSEAFLNNAELADGFQTSASSADGAALDEEDVESMSDGAGVTNEQYGKARQQAKKASGVSNTRVW